MAKSQRLLAAALLVATAMILMATSSEAGRILRLNDGAAANTVPEALNIALPGDDGGDSGCGMFEKVPGITGNYGPTLLNALPKGRLPPSGPSKGTNDLKD